MAGKVILEVTRGAMTGKKYEFDEKARVFIGRQDDCGIVMPENTVSRYHCVLDININITPPEVKLQDFGSLNGTFINGKKIGQRERDQSPEAAQNDQYEEVPLHDGDVLGLGSKCQLTCSIEACEVCAQCGAPLHGTVSGSDTVLDGDVRALMYSNEEGERICEHCYLIAERERLDQMIAARKQKEEKNRAEAEAAEKAAQAERVRIEKEKEAAEEKRLKAEEKRLKAEEERKKAEEQRLEAEALVREMIAQHEEKANKAEKKCAGCGKSFTPKAEDNNLCESCLKDRAKAIDAVLAAMMVKPASTPKALEKVLGASVLDGYDKVKLLGKGGMGEVWKVRERKTGEHFALKTVLPQVAADDQAKKLFFREADVGEQIDHKNVVKTYQSGSVKGVFYILMQLCEGGSVQDRIERDGKLSLELATYIILQVLAGLDYVHNMDIKTLIKKGLFRGTEEVHAQGVVHRDFKPGNIFLSDMSDRPIALVADFGLAKAFMTAGLSQVSQSNTVMGTPVFMPRQQALNFKYAKPEVDVWAAAASYYYMLTGELPKNFRPGKNVWQVIVSESAVPIRQRDSSIPVKLAAVIDKALQEIPEIGYKSAAALRADIIAALPEDVKAAVKDVLK